MQELEGHVMGSESYWDNCLKKIQGLIPEVKVKNERKRERESMCGVCMCDVKSDWA